MLWKVSYGLDHQYMNELLENMLCPMRNAGFLVLPVFWFLPHHARYSSVAELMNSMQQILY